MAGLRELIQQLNDEVAKGGFPYQLNAIRVGAIEAAIEAIETATGQPALRMFRTQYVAGITPWAPHPIRSDMARSCLPR
jgi:hypothetical protein